MPVQYVTASTLMKRHPNAFCFDCRQVPENNSYTSDAALWTIWTDSMFYCTRCTQREGIGPNDY